MPDYIIFQKVSNQCHNLKCSATGNEDDCSLNVIEGKFNEKDSSCITKAYEKGNTLLIDIQNYQGNPNNPRLQSNVAAEPIRSEASIHNYTATSSKSLNTAKLHHNDVYQQRNADSPQNTQNCFQHRNNLDDDEVYQEPIMQGVQNQMQFLDSNAPAFTR